jgi:orotidine-5'-phosphate decarboxylase
MLKFDRPSFAELIAAQWSVHRHLCVGLDTDASKLPPTLRPDSDLAFRVLTFNERIVDATCDLVCAYKPNSAFYEAFGVAGVEVLAKTIEYINTQAPDVPVIIDGKRGDIGSSNSAYASFLFDEMGADAATVHPYFGREALAPILDRRDKQTFVLARTSNPGAREFQDLLVDGMPLYLHVAQAVAQTWNYNGNCGLVIGATYPDELRRVRDLIRDDMPLLMPGIGAQGGNLKASVRAAAGRGRGAIIISASRSIIFASSGSNFDETARREAARLNSDIESVLQNAPGDSG